ncbi:MAG: alanine--tRNA ligase [Bdellovibrio sp.]|nr:MAG: alanine--tRNA ligase [Bdellovibrio sp.]
MKKLNSFEIKETFISFFENKDHLRIKSSSLIPVNDPTLLFVNSGMAPLKPFFLGKEKPPHPRLCNVQPCIRTIDIEDVGDRHHLTLFEMMGSWSIGDYYKEKAIELAFDLLVNGFGFPKEKLFVTVYEGNDKLGLKPDLESASAWEKVGIPRDHIVMLGEDNFWGPAGETGPCGPCTEVFFDTGEAFGPTYKAGEVEFDTKGRYIEIWNAGVFMELNKTKEGRFEPLSMKSVDTGSGVERMAMVLNSVQSVYETDILSQIYQSVMDLYKGLSVRRARILTDHLRAVTFILAEKVIPGNEGQGYVPRRLLRKCAAHVLSVGEKHVDFSPLIEEVIQLHSDWYKHLKREKDFILEQVRQELNEFVPVIERGLSLVDKELQSLKGPTFPGQKAFELVSTYGVPLDILKSHLQERGVALDEDTYKKEYEHHRNISRVLGSKGDQTMERLEKETEDLSPTSFVGYETLETHSKVIRILDDHKQRIKDLGSEKKGWIFLDQTPFYAESGGQKADVGEVLWSGGKAQITDCIKVGGGVFAHRITVLEGTLSEGQEVFLKVQGFRRKALARNHSATHLLHAALRALLGGQVVQKGSLVNADRLRFDFSYAQSLTVEQIEAIENWVNEKILENVPQETVETEYEKALSMGAIALFGEKYGDQVRVVRFGDSSVELCGGTHVKATGDIGAFIIISESSVAKGIRRIEAVTGKEAIRYIQEKRRILRALSQELSSSEAALVESVKNLKKKSKETKKESIKDVVFLKEKVVSIHKGRLFLGVSEVTDKLLKQKGDSLLASKKFDFVCLFGQSDKGLKVFVWSSQKEVPAKDLLQKVLGVIGGRGGGKEKFAQGGGGDVHLLEDLWGWEGKDWSL